MIRDVFFGSSVILVLLCCGMLCAKESNYFGKVITRGNANGKLIALTFDDGPARRFTPRIADVLKKYKVRATFFVCGEQIGYNKDIVKQLSSEGHEIANHSYSHPNLYKNKQLRGNGFAGEVTKTSDIIEELTMIKPVFFRAPYNYAGKETVEVVNRAGLIYVGWTFSVQDWEKPSPQVMLNIFLKNLQPGAIVLLHDGGGDRTNTLSVLPMMIAAAQKRGYTFVTLGELLK